MEDCPLKQPPCMDAMPLIQVSNLSRKPRDGWETRRREKILYPLERVWSALTESSQLRKWWCDEAEIDLRPGGLYAFSGKTVFPVTAPAEAAGNFEILDIDAPNRLEYRWFIGKVETKVLYEMESNLEQTELVVTQSAERCPAWPASDGHPNWWWTALPSLRSFIENGAPEIRFNYPRAAGQSPQRFEAAVPTYPWLVWGKLSDPAEVQRWWPQCPLAVASADGSPALECGGPASREVLAMEPPEHLEHDWHWQDATISRIEWGIAETDEDTIVSLTDHDLAAKAGDRVQRAIYWASTLLSLLQVSRTGTAPNEYQEG